MKKYSDSIKRNLEGVTGNLKEITDAVQRLIDMTQSNVTSIDRQVVILTELHATLSDMQVASEKYAKLL